MNKLLNFINISLENCGKSYRIVLFTNEEELFEMINNDANECHKISTDFRELIGDHTAELYIVLAFEKEKLASYLAFSIEESENYGDNFIMLKMSCTNIDFRRRGLSTVLRLVPLYFAAEQGIQFVASDANKESGALLRKKFGFTVTDDYLEQFNYDANSYIDMFSPAAKKMIDKYVNTLSCM
jgi:hypothetical protein